MLIGLFATPSVVMAGGTDDFMEVYWEFRHGGVVNTVIDSRYDGEFFYLSLADLFTSLQIDVYQDVRAGRVTGFYLKTDRTYSIDFRRFRGTNGETSIEFDSTSFVAAELGYYVRPDLLRRLFGFEITLDERQLKLRLESDKEMPVVAAMKRAAGRSGLALNGSAFRSQAAPLLYDRRRALFNGGVLAYRLSTTLAGMSPRATLSLRGGGEVLGGDMEVGGYTSISEAGDGVSPLQFELNTLRWRLVTGDSPVLRQAQLGRLSSTGLRAFSYSGVRLSNEPPNLQRYFGSYPVRVDSEPGWEIELYLNNQLVEVRKADAAGVQVFSVPITYGSTRLRIVEYGPNGEFEETERQIQVPFTFVPRGELRYTIDAGQSNLDNRQLAQGSASWGLTSAITLKMGAEYVTASRGDITHASTLAGYGQVSARLFGPYVATATYAPGHIFTATLSAYHASLLSYGLEFNRYYTEGIYNRARNVHELRANVSAPLRIGGIPFYLRANITERKIGSDRYTLHVNPEISVQPGAFRFNVGYRGLGTVTGGEVIPTTRSLETRFGYSFGREPWVPALMRSMLLSTRTVYDFERGNVQSVSLNLSRSVSGAMRAQLDVSLHFPSRSTQLGLRLQFTLPTLRASSGLQTRAGGPATFTQDVSGAVSYDAGEGSVELLQQDWVGRSAATLRFFVDADGDGQRDDDETAIEHGGVKFRSAVRTRSQPGGIVVAYNLQAYEQYSVDVDQAKIRNPLWVPMHKEFSFITDPNQHKIIDVPFFVSGEVSGTALMVERERSRPIPGLKIHLRQVNGATTSQQVVFSDGTFYVIGLPPGEYEAHVDSSQLEILKAVAEPAVRTFTLNSTETGDSVVGVDFELRPRAARPNARPKSPAEGEGDQQAPASDEHDADARPTGTPIHTP